MASGGPDADGERRTGPDAAGVVVLGACAAWPLITAAARDGRPEGMLLAVLAVAAGYAAGRIGGALLPVAAPCAGALAGITLVAWVPHLAPGPQITTPLGHAGATTAMVVLAAGAACCAAWAASGPAPRFALRLLAAGVAVTSAVLDSAAGCVAATLLLVCSLAVGRVRHRGTALAVLGLTAAGAVGLTWAVAGDAGPEGFAAALEGRLTPHRVALWQDALDLARTHAGLGVGPGRFGELSTTSVGSPLSDGKPHSAPLQLAAEQGVVGVLLAALAFGWLLYALWRSPRPTPVVLTAGTALTALALVATVGNALSFTAVTAGGGFLAGLATSRPFTDEPTRRTGEPRS
ncbi:O-antigen ligase [Streptomyces sp. T12]|uniref:O-antigen ligase family protein n=1 Tax=Streptomyces sp. T12 TaxID=477697 RepID=UPI0011ADE2AA|nr:O-antigen ligase family protein [Streptomyces sp. T12]TWD25450.1 O-antigen ligase [Streptomyces sp. T12]